MSARNPLEKKENNQLTQGLGKTQRTIVIVLVFVAVLILVAWILQFRMQLTRPFAIKGDKQDHA